MTGFLGCCFGFGYIAQRTQDTRVENRSERSDDVLDSGVI